MIQGVYPQQEDRNAVIAWADYLKSHEQPGSFGFKRDLCQKLLYGTLDDLKSYYKEVLQWSDEQCATLSEENKYHEVITQLLPIKDHSSFEDMRTCFCGHRTNDVQLEKNNIFEQVFGTISQSQQIDEAILLTWANLHTNKNKSPLSFVEDLQKSSILLLRHLFCWLTPYDLANFFPKTIDADELGRQIVSNESDLGNNQILLHAAQVFNQALHEYINEHHNDQENLARLVSYFTGSPIYSGQQLKLQFCINQNFDESAHTCYQTVAINLGNVTAQGVVTSGRALTCQQMGNDQFKNACKETIAAWDGSDRFSLEAQLQHPQQAQRALPQDDNAPQM
jgi:hypothetical protein